jgi:pilus assembly protein CpaC
MIEVLRRTHIMETTLLQRFAKHSTCLVLAFAIAIAPVSIITPKAHAVTVGEAQETLEIASGKGTLVTLPAAADAVFVSNPEVADVEIKFPELLYVYGIKPGETSIHVMDKNQKVVLSKNILVTQNIEGLRSALKKLMPDAAIEVISVNQSVVLRGVVKSAAEADLALKIATSYLANENGGGTAASGSGGTGNTESALTGTNIVNMISVGSPSQITLKVKIAEVRREIAQIFGVDFQSGGTSGGNILGGVLSRNGGTLNAGTVGTLGNLNLTSGAYQAVVGFGDGSFSIDALITALETEGYVTVLAEPNLTAVSGETASFLAGGEFPITQSDGDGGTTVTFREYGISLRFAPTLLSPDRIRLKVNPEVSELTTEGAVTLPSAPAGQSAIPGLLSRKASTTVELGNGQSFTIAGLFNQSFRDNISKNPWLGDLPVLGVLFRSQNFIRRDSELVIIVTPYIVEPVSETEIATPLDGLKVPSDKDRLLYGQTPFTSIRPTNFFGKAGAQLSGPVGFIVE